MYGMMRLMLSRLPVRNDPDSFVDCDGVRMSRSCDVSDSDDELTYQLPLYFALLRRWGVLSCQGLRI